MHPPTRAILVLICVLALAACSGPRQATPTNLPRQRALLTAVPTATNLPASPTSQTPTVIAIATPTGTILVTATAGAGSEGAGSWTPAGSLATGRAAHTASLLPSGRVLVIGGESNPSSGQTALARAEIFDPSSNQWSDAGVLGLGRRNQTATVLPSGQVLVVGGELGRAGATTSATTSSTELYDTGTNSWRTLAPAPTSRSRHTATLMPDGRVLVVGGIAVASEGAAAQSVATVEIYDPATNTWSSVGSLNHARSGHTATLLPDGRVLIVGGESSTASGTTDLTASSEIYDPSSNSWSATGPLSASRRGHTATLLANGKVLVVGGQTDLSRSGRITYISGGLAATAPSSSAELFDPQTNSWRPIASLGTERTDHTTTLLPGGQVLVVGGTGKDGSTPLATSERYDPATDRWTGASAPTARAQHTATLLPDGSVMVIGGKGVGNTYLASTERYISRMAPSAPPSATTAPTATASGVPVPPVAATSTPTPASSAPTRTTVPPTATNTPTARATNTPATATAAPTATPTNTPVALPPTATPTNTPEPPPPTATPTNTPVPPPPTATPTNTPTRTPVPPPPTNTPTNTPVLPTATSTPIPPTRTPTPTPVPQPGTVFGTVTYCLAACSPASGATVTGDGVSVTTSANGSYVLAGVGPGTISVTVTFTAPGTAPASDTQRVTVPEGGRVQLNFSLP